MSTRNNPRRGLAVPVLLGLILALMWTVAGLPGWSAAAKTGSATPPVACDSKDSPDKGWIQVFYVHREGKSRFDELRDTVKRIAWNVDQTFEASARRFGQGDSRRLRFVQDRNCQIEVTPISLAGLPDKSSLGEVKGLADNAVREQVAKGDGGWFGRHKTLYFVDADGVDGCGLGGGGNTGGLGGGFASMTYGCWGEAALTHELIHGFGINHCNEDHDQGNDPICRGYDSTPRCDDVMAGTVLDCAKDEFAYFDPRPAPGSDLQKNPGGNLANSAHLIKNRPAPPVDAQLVGLDGGRCLASGGVGKAAVQKACGDGSVWRRTIGDDGYFRLELKGTGQCLGAAPSKDRTAVLSTCDKGDERQDWWMEDAQGPAKDHYKLVNRATKQDVADGGEQSFKMLFRGTGSEPTGTEGDQPAPVDSAEQGAEPQSEGTTPAASGADDDLATTGGDSATSLSLAIGGAALLALGGAVLIKVRRKRMVTSNRHAR